MAWPESSTGGAGTGSVGRPEDTGELGAETVSGETDGVVGGSATGVATEGPAEPRPAEVGSLGFCGALFSGFIN